MPIEPEEIPRFIVLEPGGGVRLDVRLSTGTCEVEATLENAAAGRSFVLMIGYPSGRYVQRARIAGAARLYFDPGEPGLYVFLLTNPMREPAVVRMRLRPLASAGGRTASRSETRGRVTTRRSGPVARRTRSLDR